MNLPPNGVYAISKQGEQLLTLEGGSAQPGTPVFLLPPTGQPGEQEWIVEVKPGSICTIRNLRSNTYVSYDGRPEENKPIEGYPEAREWVLQPTPEPFSFLVVVPGGPIDGRELVLDLSLLRIFPPRTALRPKEGDDMRQAWKFQFRE